MSTLRLTLLLAIALTLCIPEHASAVAPPPRVDAAGFLLPARARLRLGTIAWNMPAHISCMVVSRDGKLLAVGSLHGHLRILDLTTGGQKQNWQLKGDIAAVSFANHGRTLVVDLAQIVHLFDVGSGKELASLRQLARSHAPPAVSRDGSTIALLGEIDNPRSLVRLVDPATGSIVLRRELAVPKASRAALSPDGRILATGHDDSTLRLWDVGTGKELRRLAGLEDAPHWLTFSPDGSFVAAAKHGRARVQLWDVKTGKAMLNEKERPEALHFALTPDGRSIALIFEDRVHRFDLATRQTSPWMTGCDLYLKGFAFLPDGNTVAVSEGVNVHQSIVRLWDTATGRARRPLAGASWPITDLWFVSEGARLFVRAYGRNSVWELSTGQELSRGKNYLAVSPDGATGTVADSASEFTRIDLTTEKVIARFKPTGRSSGKRHRESFASFSPDGRKVAFLFGDWPHPVQVEMFAADSGKVLWSGAPVDTTIVESRPTGYGFGFSPSGEILASTGGFNPITREFRAFRRDAPAMWLWDVTAGKRGIGVSPHLPYGSTFVFTPDDRLLLTPGSREKAGKPGLQLWDLTTGKDHLVTTIAAKETWALAFSADARFVAIGATSSRIVLWDLLTAKEVGRLEGHAEAVVALAFSPDGNTLASGSRDATILIWDVSYLRSLRKERSPDKVDPDRLWQAIAGDDGWAAWQAMWRLQERPRETAALLRKQVKPASAVEGTRLIKLIADLDSEAFATREAATRELEQLGHLAGPALEKALAGKPSLEQGLRLRRLVARLPPFRLPAPERRALLLLEWAGDHEARRLLRDLAAGAPEAILTHEAQVVLDRLKRK